MEKQNQQTVFYKEDFKWHYIAWYLDCLIGFVVIEDEEFLALFKKIRDYIETKIFTNEEGEFVDYYVTVERKI